MKLLLPHCYYRLLSEEGEGDDKEESVEKLDCHYSGHHPQPASVSSTPTPVPTLPTQQGQGSAGGRAGDRSMPSSVRVAPRRHALWRAHLLLLPVSHDAQG